CAAWLYQPHTKPQRTRALALLRPRHSFCQGLIPKRRDHDSALRAEEFLIPKSVVGDDGGTEPNGGAPFRSSLARIPFTVEGRADHFSEVCPASGSESSGQTTVQLLQQANLYSQNPLTITSLPRLRQLAGARRLPARTPLSAVLTGGPIGYGS